MIDAREVALSKEDVPVVEAVVDQVSDARDVVDRITPLMPTVVERRSHVYREQCDDESACPGIGVAQGGGQVETLAVAHHNPHPVSCTCAHRACDCSAEGDDRSVCRVAEYTQRRERGEARQVSKPN